MTQSILNIGILAHVDAGKTTITEQILYQSGSQRTIGSVDKGTSSTDNLKVEQERGISVRLATATFQYNGVKVNIIDTPGHVDFCAEVEYSLRALDAVVLVISAVEGVQGHTISLFNAINEMNIQCLIFINKIDRVGADVDAVLQDIRKTLTQKIIVLQKTDGETLISEWSEAKQNDEIVQQLVEFDDELMECYLEGEKIDFETLDDLLAQTTSETEFIPVILGAAKNGVGISKLLDALTRYFKFPTADKDRPLSSVIFKIEHDKLLVMKLFLGFLGASRTCASIVFSISGFIG